MKKIILSGFLSLMATTGLISAAEATTCSISGSIDFAYTGAIETCTVSQAGLYAVTAVGASSGWYYGAEAVGNISLNYGETLSLVIGQWGMDGRNAYADNGGGGSFVFQGSGSGATPLIVAGGGGGGAVGGGGIGAGGGGSNADVITSGVAGGVNGWGGAGGTSGGNGHNSSNGGYGGEGYIAILATPTPTGGSFGGGGAFEAFGGAYGGGGGGGYSGGGGGGTDNGNYYYGGGGGGSFIVSTATNVSITSPSNNIGNGSVDFAIITATANSAPTQVPEPSAIAVFASAIVGLVFARFWLKRRKK